MALKIRALRKGRKKLPYYRIVVIDEKKSRDGKYIENVGVYDPISKKDQFSYNLKKDLIVKWINRGAQLSEIVKKLLTKEGLLKELSSKNKKAGIKKNRKSRYHSLKDKIKKRQEDAKKKKEGEAKKKQVEKKKETSQRAVSGNNENLKAKEVTILKENQKEVETKEKRKTKEKND